MVKIFMVLVFSLKYCILNALRIGDPNVCSDSSTGEAICCFNYEIRNGRCIECKDGSTSISGDFCKPCAGHKYGYQCFYTCNCNYLQRCDKVFGCVNQKPTTILVKSNISDVSGLLQIPQTTQQSEMNKSEDNKEGLSKLEMIIYSVAGSSIILGIGITHIIRSYVKRNNSRKHLERKGESSTRSYWFDNTYDEIDETKVLKTNDIKSGINEKDYDISSTNTKNAVNNADGIRNEPDYLNPIFSADDSSSDKSDQCDDKSDHYTTQPNATNSESQTINNGSYLSPNRHSLTVSIHQQASPSNSLSSKAKSAKRQNKNINPTYKNEDQSSVHCVSKMISDEESCINGNANENITQVAEHHVKNTVNDNSQTGNHIPDMLTDK